MGLVKFTAEDMLKTISTLINGIEFLNKEIVSLNTEVSEQNKKMRCLENEILGMLDHAWCNTLGLYFSVDRKGPPT